jgi:hypothetical protein
MRSAVAAFGIAAVLWMGPVGAALADEPSAAEARQRRSAAVILSSLDEPRERESWLSDQMRYVHMNRKSGLVYERDLVRGEHPVEFQVRAPALGRKRVGLSIELRF